MRVLASLACLVPALAWAQLSAPAMPVAVTPPAGITPVRWPDVAWGGSAFLAVSGATNVQGQFFGADGAAMDAAFVVNSDALYAQAPRVAYSANAGAWLVTWHASVSSGAAQVRGRLVRQGQAPLTSDFDISPAGSNWEMGAAVAWSSQHHEFLVAWQDFAATAVKAQRVSETGTQLGAVITVDSTASYERDPAVAYDPDADRYVVAYGGCVGNNDCFIRAQSYDAATGAPVNGPLTVDGPINAGYVPELAYSSVSHRFLAVWYRALPAGSVMAGRTVAADGTLGALVTVSATYAAYDANSVAWNPVSNTFVVVTHSTSAQDAALELDADGNALNAPGLLIESSAVSGNFNPRIATTPGAADWLAVSSAAFANLSAQRLTTATRLMPPMDAGVPVNPIDAGQPDAGATETDAGEADGGAPAHDAGQPGRDAGGPGSDAGQQSPVVGSPCGCTTASPLPLALAALCMLRLRRRAGAGPK